MAERDKHPARTQRQAVYVSSCSPTHMRQMPEIIYEQTVTPSGHHSEVQLSSFNLPVIHTFSALKYIKPRQKRHLPK